MSSKIDQIVTTIASVPLLELTKLGGNVDRGPKYSPLLQEQKELNTNTTSVETTHASLDGIHVGSSSSSCCTGSSRRVSYIMDSTIDPQCTVMERAEIEKSQHRRKQALITAAAVITCTIVATIYIIALVVGRTEFGLRWRQHRNNLKQRRKDLTVACDFVGKYNSLKFCQESKGLYNIFDVSSTIPSEIGLLTHVTALKILGESVFGTIPSTLGALVNLTELSLSYTELTGTIPSTLGALVNLTELSLSFTELTGTIPSTLANLGQLSLLDLAGSNQLGGTISSSLCSVSTIQILINCNNIVCSCCECRNCNSYRIGHTHTYNCSTA